MQANTYRYRLTHIDTGSHIWMHTNTLLRQLETATGVLYIPKAKITHPNPPLCLGQSVTELATELAGRRSLSQPSWRRGWKRLRALSHHRPPPPQHNPHPPHHPLHCHPSTRVTELAAGWRGCWRSSWRPPQPRPQHPLCRHPALLDELARELAGWEGVVAVAGNCRDGVQAGWAKAGVALPGEAEQTRHNQKIVDYATLCVCNAGLLSNQHENGQAIAIYIARWIAN